MASQNGHHIDIINYVLVVLFGLSSWIGINSVWVELPIFVRNLPEKWTLPSFFSVIIQLGNFATLYFAIYNFRFAPKSTNRTSIERYSIYGLLLLQLIACSVAIFAWDATSLVAGRERSTSLLVLLFFVAVANCSSNVVFLPFLSHFPSHRYVTAYYVGSGLSGFVPSILSLVQGIGGTPACRNVTTNHSVDFSKPTNRSSVYLRRTLIGSVLSGNSSVGIPTPVASLVPYHPVPNFGVSAFFAIITVVLVGSTASFFVLNLPIVTSRRYVTRKECPSNGAIVSTPLPSQGEEDTSLASPDAADQAKQPLSQAKPDPLLQTEGMPPLPKINQPDQLRALIYMLALLAWVSGLANGIIPSIQSYATLPFGNRIFHLSISLSSLANPCVCFLAFFYPATGMAYIASLVVAATTISAFLFTMAAMSPSPWLVGTLTGAIINVVLWVAVEAIFSYIKVCLASQFHSQGKRWLLWCGVVTQIGSSLGAFSIFVMINILKLFTSGQECA